MNCKKEGPRKCKICNILKEKDSFTNGAKGQTIKTCKECRSEINKKYRKDNQDAQRQYDRERYQAQKEKRVLYARKYRTENPHKTRATNWKVKYGITPEFFYNKLKEQNNKCEICNRDMDDYGKIFCVDHNHSTGKVRGLLCDPCNYGLGFYEKHKDKYVQYLKKHNEL